MRRFALAPALAVCLVVPARPATAAELVVNALDDRDDGLCGAVHCSLREAINAANAPGRDRISFAILQGCSPRACTIAPLMPLPALVDDDTEIDGSTQVAYGPNNPRGPEIEISGLLAPLAVGLDVWSASNRIQHLVVNGFKVGIRLWWMGGMPFEIPAGVGGDNVVQHCYVGTDIEGAFPRSNEVGIMVLAGVGNEIRKSVISGNRQAGVHVEGGWAHRTMLMSNRIGSDPTGEYAVANGVGVIGIAAGDIGLGPDNVISGNAGWAVVHQGGGKLTMSDNVVGTKRFGGAELPNQGGVRADGGGEIFLDNNLISGNRGHGVHVAGDLDDVVLVRNRIGTDRNGVRAIANAGHGMLLEGGAIRPGGAILLIAHNVLSGNGLSGLALVGGGARGYEITDNMIGAERGGAPRVRNGESGILVAGGAGDLEITDNVIAGNRRDGVRVVGAATMDVFMVENSIHVNGGLGIALVGGANRGVSAPMVTHLMPAPAGGPRAVVGRGAPGAGIEVYKSSQADPSGSGEGRKHLAWGVVGANGEFSVLAAGVTPGDWLTATATVGKDTSEFSVAVRVTQ